MKAHVRERITWPQANVLQQEKKGGGAGGRKEFKKHRLRTIA